MILCLKRHYVLPFTSLAFVPGRIGPTGIRYIWNRPEPNSYLGAELVKPRSDELQLTDKLMYVKLNDSYSNPMNLEMDCYVPILLQELKNIHFRNWPIKLAYIISYFLPRIRYYIISSKLIYESWVQHPYPLFTESNST